MTSHNNSPRAPTHTLLDVAQYHVPTRPPTATSLHYYISPPTENSTEVPSARHPPPTHLPHSLAPSEPHRLDRTAGGRTYPPAPRPLQAPTAERFPCPQHASPFPLTRHLPLDLVPRRSPPQSISQRPKLLAPNKTRSRSPIPRANVVTPTTPNPLLLRLARARPFTGPQQIGRRLSASLHSLAMNPSPPAGPTLSAPTARRHARTLSFLIYPGPSLSATPQNRRAELATPENLTNRGGHLPIKPITFRPPHDPGHSQEGKLRSGHPRISPTFHATTSGTTTFPTKARRVNLPPATSAFSPTPSPSLQPSQSLPPPTARGNHPFLTTPPVAPTPRPPPRQAAPLPRPLLTHHSWTDP
uniref:Uncharacterized protein n=1 Tax=Knipowitschia caucasica TaxID=637954 RepID=A0AAV2MK26_KNICA